MCFNPNGCVLSATSSTFQNPATPLILGPATNSLYASLGGTTFGMNHVASSILMLPGVGRDSSADRAAGVIKRDDSLMLLVELEDILRAQLIRDKILVDRILDADASIPLSQDSDRFKSV
jgi:hypothetical protein